MEYRQNSWTPQLCFGSAANYTSRITQNIAESCVFFPAHFDPFQSLGLVFCWVYHFKVNPCWCQCRTIYIFEQPTTNYSSISFLHTFALVLSPLQLTPAMLRRKSNQSWRMSLLLITALVSSKSIQIQVKSIKHGWFYGCCSLLFKLKGFPICPQHQASYISSYLVSHQAVKKSIPQSRSTSSRQSQRPNHHHHHRNHLLKLKVSLKVEWLLGGSSHQS